MPSGNQEAITHWTEESSQDRRNTRWALIVAVAMHAVFFRLQLPETVAAEHSPTKRPVFVVQQARFEPPPPREQQVMPEPRAFRVPVPDKTPDDPEPLPPREVRVTVDLADTDLVLGLPEAPPPALPAGPMRVGGDVLPPVKRYSPPPRYPEIARSARIQGTVHLEAVIDAAGNVTRIRVIKGLPLGLDQAAVDAVGKWRFEPATYNGKPVPVLYNLTIHFKLT